MIWPFRKKKDLAFESGPPATSVLKNDASSSASCTENPEPTSSDLLCVLFELGLLDLQLSERSRGELQLFISDHSDWGLLDKIGEIIQKEFNGEWLSKANGLDQCYWDLKIDSSVLTLHLEHYCGIMMFPAGEGSDNRAENMLLERIYNFLSSHQPAV
jgi:hypothetical protein